MARILLPLFFVLALTSCKAPEPRQSAASPPPALFENFGEQHRDIGSKVPAAQRYFDQGLRMAYGFNHEAAGRAFAEAARLDPDCAICLWGQALVLGPNINLPMLPDAVAPAARLSAEARLMADAARPADRALIEALAQRYAETPPADRKPLDEAYAEAMAEVARRFPDDDDVATLHAEALMDLSPWAYWDKAGKPGPHTQTIVATLERVLKRNPQHIGAMHYYIHAMEASRTPQRAEPYADALAELAPGSGHLVHMPAHVYIRTGRYHDATLANFSATTADAAFLAVCGGSNGAYPLGYVPHNWHFATMSASLHGSRELAINAAEQTARRADPKQLEALSFMQQFLVAPLLTQVRFGQWDEILAQTRPPADLPYPRGIWHFARGMAYARRGKHQDAQRELEALQEIAVDPALKQVRLGAINHADRVLAVAAPMLQGELALARGQRKAGIARLRDAAKAEDALAYNEPADWPLPVRPYLGAALLDAGRASEAARIYAQDLATYPANGWSLYGLAKAQRRLGDVRAAKRSERRYKDAWQWSDTPLTASRL
jgi:tetratricopeptide (TPR) repeat protein